MAKINRALWFYLGLEDPHRRELASACLYIGLRVEEVLQLLDHDNENLLFQVSVARQCGFTEKDIVDVADPV